MEKKDRLRLAELKVKQCFFVMEHALKMIAKKDSLDSDDIKTIAYLSGAMDQIRNEKQMPTVDQ